MGMTNDESQQHFQHQVSPPQGFPFDQEVGQFSATTQSWQVPNSLMSQTQEGATSRRDGQRAGGVARRFGQVTPVTSQSRSPSNTSEDVQQQQKQQIAQSNAKSERARNAANHRHSQTKQARDQLRKGRKISASRGEEEEDEEEKVRGPDKQEYREKNRQAAAKCRRKKKDSTEVLETTARSAVEENTRLKNMVRHLRDQYSDLRTMALAHDGTGGCGCGDIHKYNADQAQQAARGHASNAPMMARDLQAMQAFQAFPAMSTMQSPIDGSMTMPDMPGMSMGMPHGRTPSFSMSGDMAMQQPQHIRADSKHEDFGQYAAALQAGGQNFAFDPSLDDIQEDGGSDGFR